MLTSTQWNFRCLESVVGFVPRDPTRFLTGVASRFCCLGCNSKHKKNDENHKEVRSPSDKVFEAQLCYFDNPLALIVGIGCGLLATDHRQHSH